MESQSENSRCGDIVVEIQVDLYLFVAEQKQFSAPGAHFLQIGKDLFQQGVVG